MAVVTYVDQDMLRAKSAMPYPHIRIIGDNLEPLSVVLQAVAEGEIAVLFTYDGKLNMGKRKISRSALEINKILEVYPIELHISATVMYAIGNIEDLLEVDEWMS